MTEVRCPTPRFTSGTCDQLMFRIVEGRIEVRCRRCNRVHVITVEMDNRQVTYSQPGGS